MPLLAIRDLEVSFASEEGRVEAVRGVSFSVPERSTVALVGESGSGKTVISQAILGILAQNARIDRGSILFADPRDGGAARDLAAIPQDAPERRAIRGARIAMVFQEPMSSLSPLHTIGDQIGEAYRLHKGVDAAAGKARTIDMLERVGFPQARRAYGLYPFELSGGLRQRAMIAMALICEPALLVADEPTTALDVTIQAQILQLIADLQRELGMAVLYITHDLGVVANIAETMVVMYRGRVMERGMCEELLRAPRHPYLKALLGAVPRLHTPADKPLAMLRKAPHRPLALGGEVMAAKAAPASGPILAVAHLDKAFLMRRRTDGQSREVRAVDDVSFDVMPGECFAIVGESGCGKTTVSKLIMRGLEPDRGSVLYRDAEGEVDVLALPPDALIRFRRKVQYIFQDPFGSLDPRMTVQQLVSEPLHIHGIAMPEGSRERVRSLLEAVGLDGRHLRRYPHSFSGGQRQRIGIARALALAPRILICDEPVSALDVSVQAQILNLLKDLQRQLGLTYVFISHNLAVVRYVAQRVGVMCAGRLVEVAPVQRLFENPSHPYTQALLSAVPEPDPDQLLDLGKLLAGRASDPRSWPEPFRLDGTSGALRTVTPDHLVRMSA